MILYRQLRGYFENTWSGKIVKWRSVKNLGLSFRKSLILNKTFPEGEFFRVKLFQKLI